MLGPVPTGQEKQAETETTPAPGSDSPGGDKVKTRRFQVFARLLSSKQLWAITALLALVAAALALAVPRMRALYHLRTAREEMQRYHNPQAIRHLKACLRIWPNHSDALLLAARAARRARAYDEAEHLLQKYQQIRGLDDAGGLEQLLLSAERRVDQVDDVCRQHIEQGHPDTSLILEALARGYLRQYRLPEARYCLDRWLQSEPDNTQALCLDGQYQLDYARAPDRAVHSYRRAVELDAELEEARVGLAITLLQAKSFADAVEHLEHMLRRQPDNLRVKVGLAECRRSLGEGDQAVRLVESVLAEQPNYAPALALRGQLALESGQYDAAESWLRQAVTRDPRDFPARYNLILCLQRSGKDQEAKEQQRVLEQREADQKRFHEIATRELAKKPHDPALHCALGELLLRSGYREEGLRWLQSALRLDSQYLPARKALAEQAQKHAGQQQGKE
jgi:tetratricopeptide (TPR) repeat protein